MNNTDNKINEAYDKFLDLSKNITEENLEASKNNIENIKDELSDELDKVEISENNINSNESIMTTGTYNPITGDVAVAAASDNIKVLSDNHFNKFTNTNNIPLTIEEIKKLVSTSDINYKELDELEDGLKVNDLIQRKIKGKKITYEELPKFLKRTVEDIAIQSADKAPSFAYLNNRSNLNYISNLLIQQLVDEYNKKNIGIDIDTMLKGFDEFDKMQNDISKEFGDMLMTFDDERKAEIDAAIERCKKEGKEDSIEKLQKMKDVIDDAYNLDKFSEFCKKVRIKKFDLEKPKKVFLSFNSKYEKHANNINDIQYCPIVLDRHLEDHNSNLKLCLAFCKYCMNFSPDNIEDHTFMYYFIRNIILIDRINPKGRLYETMDEKSKIFYDGFISNLKKCIFNLNNR